jgi:hypothetical protein
MAQRERTFKKPSYRVNERISERYIRSKCGVLRLTPILSSAHAPNLEKDRSKHPSILIDTLCRIQYSSI